MENEAFVQLTSDISEFFYDLETVEIIRIIAAAIALSGVIIAFRQLSATLKSLREENQRKRREYSLTYSLTRNSDHIESRRKLDQVFGQVSKDYEIISREIIQIMCEGQNINESMSNSEIRGHLRVLLNQWDNLALSINNGVADEETAFEMVGQTLVSTIYRFQHYIQYVYEKFPAHYKHLVWLHKRWSVRQKAPKIKLPAWKARSKIAMRPLTK